jgi:tRNA (adenine57-N1/adenine58-N1)-methyltransferase
MFAHSKRFQSLLNRNGLIRHFNTFEPGDFCMLRQVRSNKKFFVGPLEKANSRGVKGGNIAHDDIIGKKPRSVIRTGNGEKMFKKSFVYIV